MPMNGILRQGAAPTKSGLCKLEPCAQNRGSLMRKSSIKKSQRGHIKILLILFLMVGFWVWFFGYVSIESLPSRIQHVYEQVLAKKSSSMDDSTAVIALKDSAACEANLPPSGSQFTYGTSKQSNVLHSRFYVSNEHVFPVLLVVSEADTAIRYQVLMLHPQKSSLLQLPVGRYQLAIQSGSSWCNINTGFTHGVEVAAPQLLEIKANQVTNLRLMAFGDAPADIMFSFSTSLGVVGGAKDQRPEGIGSLELQRVVGGHYAVEASVNGVPVYFMVDTGATLTAISAELATHAGITDCEKSKTQTANGVTDVCIGTVQDMTVGQFRLKNVKVTYSKGLGDTALLGMNVIGQFRMEQQGDVMRLSIH